ncbi:hypothetical protein [Novosphingobium acidiphilum]|uniref:hypothetical protein n=1 Tax=Novosphingobium acidiphilum TaxID=505248 RepID=UPI00048A6EEE|nr:hypothetical protein [Novosphingobium acidiphilum]
MAEEFALYALFVLTAALLLLPAPLIARWIVHRNPGWNRKLISLVSSSPVPVFFLSSAIFFEVEADFKAIDGCGQNQACVTGVELAQILFELSGIAFFVGVFLSALILFCMKRFGRVDMGDIFQ